MADVRLDITDHVPTTALNRPTAPNAPTDAMSKDVRSIAHSPVTTFHARPSRDA